MKVQDVLLPLVTSWDGLVTLTPVPPQDKDKYNNVVFCVDSTSLVLGGGVAHSRTCVRRDTTGTFKDNHTITHKPCWFKPAALRRTSNKHRHTDTQPSQTLSHCYTDAYILWFNGCPHRLTYTHTHTHVRLIKELITNKLHTHSHRRTFHSFTCSLHTISK